MTSGPPEVMSRVSTSVSMPSSEYLMPSAAVAA